MKGKCESCEFYVTDGWWDRQKVGCPDLNDEDSTGHCHIRSVEKWPPREGSDQCGEWEENGEEKAKRAEAYALEFAKAAMGGEKRAYQFRDGETLKQVRERALDETEDLAPLVDPHEELRGEEKGETRGCRYTFEDGEVYCWTETVLDLSEELDETD